MVWCKVMTDNDNNWLDWVTSQSASNPELFPPVTDKFKIKLESWGMEVEMRKDGSFKFSVKDIVDSIEIGGGQHLCLGVYFTFKRFKNPIIEDMQINFFHIEGNWWKPDTVTTYHIATENHNGGNFVGFHLSGLYHWFDTTGKYLGENVLFEEKECQIVVMNKYNSDVELMNDMGQRIKTKLYKLVSVYEEPVKDVQGLVNKLCEKLTEQWW